MKDSFKSFVNNLILKIKSYFTVEKRWVGLFAVVVMVITSLPYVLGWLVQGDQWYFTGFIFGVEDGNSYIAKMLRGSVGDWLFRTPYTAYSQEGAFVYFPFILLGKFSNSPNQHEKLLLLYHVARFFMGICMILATYDFVSVFIHKIQLRRWALFVAILGGGLGWLLVVFGASDFLGSLPLEYYSPESFGFLHLLGLPHLAMARALFLWGMVLYLKSDKKKKGVYAGLLWLVAGLFQPISIAIAWIVIGAHNLIFIFRFYYQRTKTGNFDSSVLRSWLIPGIHAVLISSPIVVYVLFFFNVDPIMKVWSTQNLILSPHPGHYLFAYGLLVIMVIIGFWGRFKESQPKEWLLLVWIVIFPLLVYAPYPLQRRLAEGFWVALTVLVFIAYEYPNSKLPRKSKYLLLLVFPSTLFLLVGGILFSIKPVPPLFRPHDEIVAFNYLAKNSDGEAVVLSSFETGNPLPAWAPVFVVIGHGPESVNLSKLQPRVNSFFQTDTSMNQRIELLEEFNVAYVFWGPNERHLGDWQPKLEPYLSLVHQSGEYYIYQVDLSKK